MEKLLTGVAYHGNRILRHVEEDMRDIVNHNMNLVVHMFSHNDWDRHKGVMPDIIKISEAYGLEVWISYKPTHPSQESSVKTKIKSTAA